MRVIPVLDLKAGHVVRGIGGRRAEYRPLVGRLVASSQPLDVARAVRAAFGLDTFYLADLDAIAGALPDFATYAALQADGFHLWIDAGLREAGDAAPLVKAGVEVLVAGLETLRGPDVLAELVSQIGPDRVLFSLDLEHGKPLGDLTNWRGRDADTLAAEAAAVGVRRLLILDLAHVGGAAGTGTNDLVERIRAAHPQLRVAVGGGVRGVDDLHALARQGVDAVLVASALHDGQLTREDLRP